ncbi:MAG: hypothetical protein E4H24_03505 [Thermomicrobiales bacterium]|nr:MAG: hypothetical protein E4H24_03505 [Thermomicrobiales bacterium]
MTIVDTLNEIWTQILDVTSVFVIPDWGGLIAILPMLIVLGLVLPFLTFLMLGTMIYLVRKPRTKLVLETGPRIAEIGAGGEPVFPVGLPHCRRDRLVFLSGTVRCERCRDELAVICPMCNVGRAAIVDTCTNCGLVLKVAPRAVAIRTTPGPRPGGAAAA